MDEIDSNNSEKKKITLHYDDGVVEDSMVDVDQVYDDICCYLGRTKHAQCRTTFGRTDEEGKVETKKQPVERLRAELRDAEEDSKKGSQE